MRCRKVFIRLDSEQVNALLGSKRAEDRIRGVQACERIEENRPRRQLLLRALTDRTHYVAALAAEQLGTCADLDACATMLDHFDWLAEQGPKRDPGCHVRAALTFAFGRLEYLNAAEALKRGIKTVQIEAVAGVPFDTGTHLRANCALALAHMGSVDSIRDIAILLFDRGDHREEAQKAAARALGHLGRQEALIPLAIKLTYPANDASDVIQECMQAVVALEDERALELLSPFLSSPNPNLVAYAALMVGQTGSPEALSLILKTIDALRGPLLRAVVLGLSSIRSDEAQAAVRALLGSDRREVREAAAEAIG